MVKRMVIVAVVVENNNYYPRKRTLFIYSMNIE
jgi:hypothetical protein